MRTSDKTLVASLGFADKDKRDNRHDAACQYIAGSEMFDTIAAHWPLEQIAKPYRTTHVIPAGAVETGVRTIRCHQACAMIDEPIIKGEGQYKSFVGFIDVLIEGCRCVHEANIIEDDRPQPDRFYSDSFFIGCEVKIGEIPVGDILRQIKLYRSFSLASHWCLVLAWQPSAYDVQAFENENIAVIVLGNGFYKYYNERKLDDSPANIAYI